MNNALAYEELAALGVRAMDELLFNGEYYEQEVRPPASPSEVAPGLRVGMVTAKQKRVVVGPAVES